MVKNPKNLNLSGGEVTVMKIEDFFDLDSSYSDGNMLEHNRILRRLAKEYLKDSKVLTDIIDIIQASTKFDDLRKSTFMISVESIKKEADMIRNGFYDG